MADASLIQQVYDKTGKIIIWGEFTRELEENVVKLLSDHHGKGETTVDFIINSNGGRNDAWNAILGAMNLLQLKARGIVVAKALSSGFMLLQGCYERIALPGAQLMFHWGTRSIDNADLSSIAAGRTWLNDHIKSDCDQMINFVMARTGLSADELREFAMYERFFNAEEALALNIIDRIIRYDQGVEYVQKIMNQ